LYVGSPVEDVDGELNAVRRELAKGLVKSVMSHDVFRIVDKHVSDEAHKTRRSNMVLSVELNSLEAKTSPRANIEFVHQVLGPVVDGVVRQFAHRVELALRR
jgi:hypothetical protein